MFKFLEIFFIKLKSALKSIKLNNKKSQMCFLKKPISMVFCKTVSFTLPEERKHNIYIFFSDIPDLQKW